MSMAWDLIVDDGRILWTTSAVVENVDNSGDFSTNLFPCFPWAFPVSGLIPRMMKKRTV
jgi:hypothetical protein